MAYLFDDASSQYLSQATPAVTAMPFTVAMRVRTDTQQEQAMFCLSGATSHIWILQMKWVAPWSLIVGTDDGTSFVFAESSSGLSTATWYHICAVFGSATSRIAYVDGGNSGSNATSRSPTVTRMTIAADEQGAGLRLPWSGECAELALWNVALSATEVALIAPDGVSPFTVRPDALVHYAPLVRGLQDSVGGLTWTANAGPTVATHVRIIQPGRRRRVVVPSGISDLSLSEAEAVSIGEVATVLLPTLTGIALTEGVVVGETVSLSISQVLSLSVTDGVTVDEAVILNMLLMPSLADAVTVGEVTVVALEGIPLTFSVSDAITIGDTVSVSIGAFRQGRLLTLFVGH